MSFGGGEGPERITGSQLSLLKVLADLINGDLAPVAA
jgi:hypothetical protein